MGVNAPGLPPRVVEIETVDQLDQHLARTSRLAGCFVQSLDLTGREAELLATSPDGAVFLGCCFTEAAEEHLRHGGALLFPRLATVPFDPYRGRLYDPEQLYDQVLLGGAYGASTDAQIYAWTRRLAHPPSIAATLAMSLHDHAVGDALSDLLTQADPSQTVGVMGGHAAERGSREYAAAADLGLRLAASGRTLLTGGGPGAMEAANLGAFLVGCPQALPEALALLAEAPTFKDPVGIDRWASVALQVRQRHLEQAGTSIGIPTWFYGHEPPNVFATGVAKYFSNAIREDVLLARCRGGIIYLPGRAGTVQEVFQAATESYYAADDSLVAPMVLVGKDYWTATLPAWPLLQALGTGRAMEAQIHLVDSVHEALDVLA